MLDRIRQLTGLADDKILNVYPYGSRVYGTASKSSDYDFIMIANTEHTGNQYDSRDGDLTVHLYNTDHWRQAMFDCRIFALECAFLPKDKVLKETVPLNICGVDLATLRKEISSVSSNSWVKAKKKIEIEHEHYLGFKSLFHSLRIPMFGIQIASKGSIYDYSIANHYWQQILHELDYSRSWDSWKEEYQPIRNAILTEFRKYAEK